MYEYQIPEEVGRLFAGGEILVNGQIICHDEIPGILNVRGAKTSLIFSKVLHEGGSQEMGEQITGIENDMRNYKALSEIGSEIRYTKCDMPKNRTRYYFEVKFQRTAMLFVYDIDPDWALRCDGRSRGTCSCPGC